MSPLPIRTKIRLFESLLSLVFRLTEANVYESPSRIINGLTDSPKHNPTPDVLSDPNTFRILSYLNKCSEDDIFSTTIHRFTKFFPNAKNSPLMDSSMMKNYIRRSSTRYCPLCIRESGYHRIYWDMLPITICLKHKVILKNACPLCKRPVTVYRVLRNKCVCGKDLLSVNTVSIASYPEAIYNQLFIQTLLEVNEFEYFDNFPNSFNSPATGLDAPDFFKLLRIFSIVLRKLPQSSEFLKLGNITSEAFDGIDAKKRVSNVTNFILINSAVSILLEWPQKFYEFLDDYSTIDLAEHRTIQIQKAFGGLKELLFDKLDNEMFEFIHSAYSDYLNERWKGVHPIANKTHYGVYDNKENHITIVKSAHILGINPFFVPQLIDKKIIQAAVIKINTKTKYLVDLHSVYALKRKVDSMLSLEDLSWRLDLNIEGVKSLAKSGLLPAYTIRPWSREYSYHFEPVVVEKFERIFLSEKRYSLVDKKPEGYLTAAEALTKISHTLNDISKLLHLVKKGVFNPILCKEGKSLSRLLLIENEIKNYQNANIEKKIYDNTLSVHRTGNILGIDTRFVQYLIDIGLITAITEDMDGEQKIYISKKDMDEFKKEYLFIEEAAMLMGFDTKTVLQWIKQGRLNDYSEIPITKRTSFRILRREEVKPFMSENNLDLSGAAEFLNLTPWEVYKLIDKKTLATLKGKGLGKTPFHKIPRDEIIRYKENLLDLPRMAI